MKDFLTLFPPPRVTVSDPVDRAIRASEGGILKKVNMTELTDYFKEKRNLFAFGEFWGKLMRAMCLTFTYTHDFDLLKKIDATAEAIMSLQNRATGELSACPTETQPRGSSGSDIWERKYLLTGLLAYYDISGRRDALDTCVRLADYTSSQVGDGDGKMKITDTGWAFCGIESSSILEPLMRLYSLTQSNSALALSKHILALGACGRENIFEAIRLGKSPYQIGDNGNPKESIAKAYEMTSCFEGLAEYARATEDKAALEAVKIYWDKVACEEITLLGSGGADAPYNLGPGTGEQWNRTAYEQTNPDIKLGMETCVTVYWMRLCASLYRLTGEMKYIETLEVSLYNALLGAVRLEDGYFEYFPRFNGARDGKINFAYTVGGMVLTCCSVNGPTGLAMIPPLCVTERDGGIQIGLYRNMTFETEKTSFTVSTAYPQKGDITVKTDRWETGKRLYMRVPTFAKNPLLNGKPVRAGTFAAVNVSAGDTVTLTFDISVIRHPAPRGSNRAGDDYVAYTYGSLLLGRTDLFGDSLDAIPDGEITAFTAEPSPIRDGYVKITVNGRDFYDYQSLGKTKYGTERFVSWHSIKKS